MAAHDLPRYTGDIDFWVRPSPENARRVWDALVLFGAPLGDVTADYFSLPGRVYQMGTPPLRIDVMTSVQGVTFDEAWPGRMPIDMDGLQVPVIGRAELLKNKRATGRKKDRLDAEQLEGHRD